jgi:Predicted transcriptional regulators containing the CopG/Arc/MetJ DNA-binding domain and a metal-binding domain
VSDHWKEGLASQRALIALSMIIPIVILVMTLATPSERVTVTMPADLVAGIDRFERNRSRFIADAVRHELKRRRRLELLRSLEGPHPDSITTAALGLESWHQGLSDGDDNLLDPRAGVPLRWSEEQGWQEPEA